MKKLLALTSTCALALSLTIPAWARGSSGAQDAPKAEKKEEKGKKGKVGKPHWLHGKKKGATEGKKEGQEGTKPGKATKK